MTILVFCTFLLAGCGQKGDLYLPENASAPALTPQ
ncbi:LPS translocon maturation chaperone LptM [Endozoicomonas euniceicola]